MPGKGLLKRGLKTETVSGRGSAFCHGFSDLDWLLTASSVGLTSLREYGGVLQK